MSEARYDWTVKSLGLAVRLWAVRRRSAVFDAKLAAKGCKDFANKLRTVVNEQVGWDPKRRLSNDQGTSSQNASQIVSDFSIARVSFEYWSVKKRKY